MSSAAGATARRGWLVAALFVFGATLAVLLAHHEMWRDELQAWLLARDSGSLGELWRNTRYEGHPLLWHLMLFLLSRFVADPAAMQVLHWAIAVAAVGVVLFASPFPVWVRVPLAFTYFPLYEYGAISRNYALTALGVWVAFAALGRRGSPFVAAAGGAVAANASPMGILLAPAIGCAIWGSPAPRRRRGVALGVLAAATAAGALQCLPPADYEHARGLFLAWDLPRAAYVARGLASALLPVPRWGLHFWNSSAVFPGVAPGQPLSVGGLATIVFLLGAGVAVAITLRRLGAVAIAWLVGVVALGAFAYAKFPGDTRHWGFVWVLLVGTVWLAVAVGGMTRRLGSLVLAPTIVAGLAGSFVAAWWDWSAPFAGASCAARRLREQRLDGLPLVGGVDYAASGVAAYLPGAKLYYPASRGTGSFIVWNLARTSRDRLTDAEIVREGCERDSGRGVIVVVNRELTAGSTVGCREAFHCGPTVVPDESLWGYLCCGPPGAAR